MNSDVSETNSFCLQSLIEFIQDADLDIVTSNAEEKTLPVERFAHIVQTIGNRLRLNSLKKVVDYSFKLRDKEYSIRVNNNLNGFVSVTNDDGVTGVCNTVYYPFFKTDDGWVDGLCNLAEMINEAWYYSEY